MITVDSSVLAPGTRTARVPITILPSGQACSLQVLLTSDAAGLKGVGQSNVPTFSSTGAAQNVTATLTAPAAGTYYVFVAVYVSGILVGVFPQGADNVVIVPGIAVGPIVWS